VKSRQAYEDLKSAILRRRTTSPVGRFGDGADPISGQGAELANHARRGSAGVQMNNRETDVVRITLYVSSASSSPPPARSASWSGRRAAGRRGQGIKKQMVAIGKDADPIDTC
jgi:hypothetical protein